MSKIFSLDSSDVVNKNYTDYDNSVYYVNKEYFCNRE